MSLVNIEKTITLDVYDHDTTHSVVKTIQMDTGTRTVFAMIQNSRQDYDIGQNATVSLTVLRPDKTKVQITGQPFIGYTGTDGTTYGAKAELSDVALAVKGNLKAQFKITSGDQELRTEIFTINNGEALDAGDGDWAGDLDGHNLDEMAESIETLQTDMAAVNEDVSDLKEDFNAIEDEIAELPKTVTPEEIEADLYISDANGNVLAEFADGHIKTKNFDSADIEADADVYTAPSDSDADADISDVNGNVLARFKDGNLYTKNFDSTLIRNLTKKKWVCLGDSLTEHNQRTTLNYHDYIAQETGIIVHNLGHSGCGYAKVGGNGQNFVNQADNIPDDASVITVFGSGNDGSASLDIGTPTDSGTTTLCGYMNATFDKIYEEHPTTPLGVITPTPWASKEPSDSNKWMENYSNALMAICSLRGIPCLDLYHCSNLHPTDVNFRPLAYSKDDGDGVHPDETGHALIAPRIRQFLFSLI